MVILTERRVTKIEMSESLPFRYCSFRLFNGCVKTRNSRNRPRATSHARQRDARREREKSEVKKKIRLKEKKTFIPMRLAIGKFFSSFVRELRLSRREQVRKGIFDKL